MTKITLKQALPYAGIPVICALFVVLKWDMIGAFGLLQFGLLIVFGYIASVFDIREKRIPNGLVLAMLAGWVITIVPQLFYDTEPALIVLRDALLGCVICGGLLLLVYYISKKGLGGGDVKFMAAAGLYLGFQGVLPAMLYGSILAGLTGVTLILIKKIGRKDSIPLAPFLYVGILITVFFQ